MFIRRIKYEDMEDKIRDQKREIRRLKESVAKWEEENRALRDDLDYEHEENCNQHKKLLEISRRIEKPFATIKDALDLKKDIKKVLSNT